MDEGNKLEVLLADDEPHIRDRLKKMLTDAGFSVRAVTNGARALESFQSCRADSVVLDVRMPILSGYEACREIRKLDREVPIVFLSALDRDEDQIAGLEVGADDYISKLASSEMMIARIKSAIMRARRFSSDEAPHTMTKTEANIYRLLRSSPGKLFSYREIFAAIFGEGYYADEGALRSHISHLRKKLPAGVKIAVKRGQGFYLAR